MDHPKAESHHGQDWMGTVSNRRSPDRHSSGTELPRYCTTPISASSSVFSTQPCSVIMMKGNRLIKTVLATQGNAWRVNSSCQPYMSPSEASHHSPLFDPDQLSAIPMLITQLGDYFGPLLWTDFSSCLSLSHSYPSLWYQNQTFISGQKPNG